MKILITGVHGFVGNNLVDYLSQDNVIYGLDIIAPEKAGVERTFTWDELDAGVVPSVDAIIHLAGKAHDTKNQAAADVYFKVNTDLTVKIFDYFLSQDIKKFVFFSTAKAAADKVDGILTEDVIPSPVGPYGESKIAAEKYIFNAISAETGNVSDRGIYIFRPCMIHGPGNKGNLNLLYNVVKKGIPWPLGSFENLRTFTSIENMCFAVKGVLVNNVDSGIYNMGDDEPVSTNELIAIICSVMRKRPRIWRLPKWLMEGFAKIGTLLHLPLNSERLRKLTENYVSSNQKIKGALHIEQFPVGAKEGLERSIRSFHS